MIYPTIIGRRRERKNLFNFSNKCQYLGIHIIEHNHQRLNEEGKEIENKNRSLLLFALASSGKSHSHSLPFSSSVLLYTIAAAIATVITLTLSSPPFFLSLSLSRLVSHTFHHRID